MTQLILESNSKNNIDLLLKPIKAGEAITEDTVRKLINSSEYQSLHLNTANIKNAIAELNDTLKPLQANQPGREIRYQVLERRDASISVSIDTDEMSAVAEISTALGGKHLSAKAILSAAQQAGVKKGFSKEELVQLAQEAAKSPPGTTVSHAIAHGREAINGKDAKIKHLVQSAQERILRPKKQEDGTVDMRDLGDIICVKVGDPLAQKIPLTEGKIGYTVTATPITPEPGQDIELKAGEGTSFSPKNDRILISELVGLPKIIENGMEVDEVYKIKNVDVSTGNITFEGSVIIEGDVCEGMKVVASGDVNISGFVESAYIEAGGDITITGGIIGHKHEVESADVSNIEMSVSLIAKGHIYAKYCQYANLKSLGDIKIENQLMHSIIELSGRLWVGSEEKANGKLIGGSIQAGVSVHAGIVGATAGSNTYINFDKEIGSFKQQLNNIEERLKEESDKTDELRSASNKLKKLPKDKAQPKMLNKVITTYRFHAARMAEILEEKQTKEEELQAYMASVYVEATEKLYHGVELIVGDFNDRSRREYGPSRMLYKERKIHIDPIVNT
jgi:uncharacterized protein (DUF342 family)